MKLKHTVGFFKKCNLPERVQRGMSYADDNEPFTIETAEVDIADVDRIYMRATKDESPLGKKLVRQIDSYRALLANPESEKVGRLDRLATVLTEYIRRAPHKILFEQRADDQLCPYIVESIVYHPPSRERVACVVMQTIAISLHAEAQRSKMWESGDIGGRKTAPEILAEAGWQLETESAYAAYLAELKRYHAIVKETGRQYRAEGVAFDTGRYSRSTTAMVREGVPARVIIDDAEEEGDRSGREVKRTVSMRFWSTKKEQEDEEGEEITAAVPVHPYVKVFDLARHRYVGIHVNNIEPYVYDPHVVNKLVLPQRIKRLIEVLMHSSNAVMEDIVAGKTGGVVVIATGEPGTGKTLTAECYSEQIKRPLYSVQCSQLGTDEEKLEAKLTKVLARASRWGAILLIDEADVYVRERADDIQQNAIVGVFLRLLERYRGILFLTSNRATIIDDAIMSRAIAHVQYSLPNKDEAAQLWDVLSTHYGVQWTPEQKNELKKLPANLSGRSIKNTLRLAKIMATAEERDVRLSDIATALEFVETRGLIWNEKA